MENKVSEIHNVQPGCFLLHNVDGDCDFLGTEQSNKIRNSIPKLRHE